MVHFNKKTPLRIGYMLRAFIAGGTCAIALSLSGAAQAQSGCSAAMPDFMAALKTNTVAAIQGFLDQHAPCFEEPARAKLQELGGSASAPAPAAPTGYSGAPVSITVLGSRDFVGPVLVGAELRFWNEAVPSIGNVSANVLPDYDGYNRVEYVEAIKNGNAAAAVIRSSVAIVLGGAFGRVLAGLDMPLLSVDASEAQAVQNAVLPRVRDAVRSQGLMILGAGPAMPSMLICNQPVASLGDLRGRKVVAFEPASEAVAALGGQVLKLPPSDALSALEQGSIDCVVTTAPLITRVGLHQTGKYLMPATALGWGVNALVMNAQFYDGLPEEVRTGLLQQADAQFSGPMWNDVSWAMAADIGCMTGTGACANGVAPGNLQLANPLPLDASSTGALMQSILPNWAATAPAGLVDGWRADAGGIVNLQ